MWFWGQLPPASIAKKVGRTRGAVLEKARRMGLKLSGNLVSVSALARRCGCDREALFRILKEARVRVQQGPKGVKARMRYVDELEGVVAYEEWLATESIRGAARRYGTSQHWIARRLRAAGVQVKRGGRGTSTRLRPEVVDEAVRSYAG